MRSRSASLGANCLARDCVNLILIMKMYKIVLMVKNSITQIFWVPISNQANIESFPPPKI